MGRRATPGPEADRGPPAVCGRGRSKIGLPRCIPPNICAAPSGALYTGRGPVCGMIVRFAGAAGATGADSTICSGAAAIAAGCCGEAVIGWGAGAEGAGAGFAAGAAGAASGTATGRASCAGFFVVETPAGGGGAAPGAGGFTITGPVGAFDAMAGAATTIGGACLGCGTILRGAGALGAPWPAGVWLAGAFEGGAGGTLTTGFRGAGDEAASAAFRAAAAWLLLASRCRLWS